MLAENVSIQTMRWNNECLEMIDQRVLPERFEYIAYSSAEEVAKGIKEMVVRGAPAIGVAAAYGIALEALRLKDLSTESFHASMNKAFTELAASRPTSVNLFWALEKMQAELDTLMDETPEAIANILIKKAHDLYLDDIRINRAMGENGAKLLQDGARVLTHCNAGALATAGHGTALGILRSAVESGKKYQ